MDLSFVSIALLDCLYAGFDLRAERGQAHVARQRPVLREGADSVSIRVRTKSET